ncbi:hypothetical protein BN946_scf184281.g11 [Trametes cinnabarina]|uniref:Uncharacterized protein n=1 Tax=Pycnoporus cinnabarinus TaxID=5643 RepID=A0A060SXJ4_PYCCI|nr:hypothetical protein BN946_scf184281.g11 [Trametes cinnabarina]
MEGAPSSTDITVFGRKIRVPWSVGKVCKFTFSDLCDASLGAADYITLAARYHTFIITSIPALKVSAKNQARRFISLIDALYEARCRLICLAEATPERLFFPDASAETSQDTEGNHPSVDVDVMMAEAVGETQEVYRPNVSSYDAPNMERERAPSVPLALDKLSIFSGKDEQFAFKRALSRLLEMTSESYARDEQWNPLPAASRKWETSSSFQTFPHPSSPASPMSPLRAQEHISNPSADFAEEASTHASHPDPSDRPPAPRLSPDHVWGVREDWGPRAREWGRGASVYSSASTDNSNDHDNDAHASGIRGHSGSGSAEGHAGRREDGGGSR